MKVKTCEIIIPRPFLESQPSTWKLAEKRKCPEPIILTSDMMLVDGYASYVVKLSEGASEVEGIVMDRKFGRKVYTEARVEMFRYI